MAPKNDKKHKKQLPGIDVWKSIEKEMKIDPLQTSKTLFLCNRGYNFHYFLRPQKWTLKVTEMPPKLDPKSRKAPSWGRPKKTPKKESRKEAKLSPKASQKVP